MAFFGLMRSWRHDRAGFALYATAVAAARNPYFYGHLGVPDTLDGRFDLVGLHAFLLIRRLRGPGTTRSARIVGQAVFDAMFSDMDTNLREIGVGDMSVGKRVRAMWEAFHGRAAAYEAALQQPDNAALAEAIGRNVWRGAAGPDAARLAGIIRALDLALAAQPLATLTEGSAIFLDPAQALDAAETAKPPIPAEQLA